MKNGRLTQQFDMYSHVEIAITLHSNQHLITLILYFQSLYNRKLKYLKRMRIRPSPSSILIEFC